MKPKQEKVKKNTAKSARTSRVKLERVVRQHAPNVMLSNKTAKMFKLPKALYVDRAVYDPLYSGGIRLRFWNGKECLGWKTVLYILPVECEGKMNLVRDANNNARVA